MNRMNEFGWVSRSLLLALSGPLAVTACEGSDVSTGVESSTVNLESCYGEDTHCSADVRTTLGVEVGVRDCDAQATTTLTELFRIDQGFDGYPPDRVEVAADGSIWVLVGASGWSNVTDNVGPIRLLHFDAEGTLLGASVVLDEYQDHTEVVADLTVDAAGHAVVSIYTLYAETADSTLVEMLTVHEYDLALQEQGEPQIFAGVSGDSLVSAGKAGEFTLAGDALDNAKHGVVARVKDREPLWIQTHVPTSGRGAGVGVSGLATGSDGQAWVLGQRNPRWEEGEALSYIYGVAAFSPEGNLSWDLQLPTAYAHGYRAALGALPQGGVVVAGLLDEGKVLVRSVSPRGQPGWAYQAPGPVDAVLAVDQDSGMTLLPVRDGLAVVSESGDRCVTVPFDTESASEPFSVRDLAIAGERVYLLTQLDLRVVDLPESE